MLQSIKTIFRIKINFTVARILTSDIETLSLIALEFRVINFNLNDG